MKKFIKSSYFLIILIALYIPVIVMMFFSFNSGSSLNIFSGWSLKWYKEFINNSPFLKSIITSLFVAITSTIISMVIGMMAVIGLWKMPQKKASKWLSVSNIPLINADVVTAVALMIVFLLAGIKFGIVTLICAHVSFNVPYVIITVMPFVRKIDKNLISASKDLGSNETQTIFKVIIPILKPAIITAVFICFAMSFDDFIISYFTSGTESNFSSFIYTAKRVEPYVNAFGTILVFIIFLGIFGWNFFGFFVQKTKDDKMKIKKGEYKLKKIAKLKKQIEYFEQAIESSQKIRYSKNLNKWRKYFLLKAKLKFLKNKNFNSKISRLEWKRELLSNEIKSEKRVFKIHDIALKKKLQIEEQMNKKTNSHRIPRFQNALDKLEKKLHKLEKEIDYINEKRIAEHDKVQELSELILELQSERNQTDLSDKNRVWNDKKIKELEIKKNIFLEGKNKYKLRTTIEKLSNLKNINLEQIQKTYDKLNFLETQVIKKVSLTEILDKKINHAIEMQWDKKNIEELKEKQIILMKDIKDSYHWKAVKLNEILKRIDVQKRRKTIKFYGNDNIYSLKQKPWIIRSWKGLSLTGIIGVSFAGLTAAYVVNNTYDIVIGNWGSYIDMSLISDFEKEYNVKVNYQQYDSNESLYNKLHTMNYDVMVPSDYMVQRLYSENQLEVIDWSRINGLQDPHNSDGNVDENKSPICDTLKEALLPDDSNEKSVLDYAIPYFWGDVRSAFNLKNDKLVSFLNEENKKEEYKNNQMTISQANGDEIDLEKMSDLPKTQSTIDNFSWNMLWDAADAGLNVCLSSDAKNLFMIGSKSMGYGVEPTIEQIGKVQNKLKQLIKHKNVSLLGDELIDRIQDSDFDIAVGYNGDILFGEQVATHRDEETDDNVIDNFPFATAQPVEGTNIWNDDMVINKENRNIDLSYKFVNFIIDHSEYLSTYVGYPVASQKVVDDLKSEDGDFDQDEYGNLFEPEAPNGKTIKDYYGSFTYNQERDNAILNAYNELLATKN